MDSENPRRSIDEVGELLLSAFVRIRELPDADAFAADFLAGRRSLTFTRDGVFVGVPESALPPGPNLN